MSARLFGLVLLFNVLPFIFLGCEDSVTVVDLRTNGSNGAASGDNEKEEKEDGEDSDDIDEEPEGKETTKPKAPKSNNGATKTTKVGVENNEEMAKLQNIDVYSYNLGLGDSIPCSDSRKAWSLDHLGDFFKKYTENDKLFFVGLQEVWSKKDYETIKQKANNLGFKVYPEKHLADSGIVTITNAYVTDSRWDGFTQDTKPLARGILQVDINMANQKISLVNTDTASSSNEEEGQTHKAQLEKLFKALEGQNNIVVGSFYAGPEGSEIVKKRWNDDILPHIGKEKLNLNSPFSEDTITWDKDNNLTSESPIGEDSMLDNILFTESVLESSSPEVMEHSAPGVCENGGEFDYASDHYGLKSTFSMTAEEEDN